MKEKVALFDFDNTIAQGDSIYRLIQWDLKHHFWHIFHLLKAGVLYLLSSLHIISFLKTKSALLFPLRYMDEKDLERFYQEAVKIYYYDEVVEELMKKKEEGYKIIVCTASVEDYMKYMDLPVDQVIGTKTVFQTGKIIGKNCKGEEKIPRILDYLQSQNIEIDYDHSYGYSDSDSDRPMLSLVKHKKRVLLKTGHIVDFK